MLACHTKSVRRGIAAVEMALIAPVLLILLLGIWEVGRMIMIRNKIDQAAREGGRLASSASLFAGNNKQNPLGGTLSLSYPSTNSNFEVQRKVILFLQAAGISTNGVTVQVENLGDGGSKNWSYTWTQTTATTGTGSGSGFDPSAAADQLDLLRVTVSVPYKNIAWSPINWFVGEETTLTAVARWSSMRDVPLSISTTIPSQPLGATDPLP